MNNVQNSLRLFAIAILFTIFSVSLLDAARTKIACIGNSITCCYHYPDSLQALLRRAFVGVDTDTVANEGVTTTTMLKPAYSNCSYWNNGKLAQVFSFKPDIITIMLGTNDAKQGTLTGTGCNSPACINNWKNKAQFTPAYYAMIDTLYSTLGYKPKIFCVFPPPAAPNNVICDAETSFTKEMIPMIQQVAAARGLPTINCHLASYQSNPSPTDGIHPNQIGIDSLAHWFYEGLMTIRMIAFPAGLNFTVSRGQTDTTGTTAIDSILNPSIAGTLDTIHVTHQTSWLQCATTTPSLNSQKVKNGLVLASLPATTGTWYDTVTVTALKATPTTLHYVVTLTVQQGTGIRADAYATPDFVTDIRLLKSHAIRVSLFNPGDYSISIMTTAGRVIAFRSVRGPGAFTLRTTAGSPATYIVRVKSSDGGKVATKKIIDVIE